MKPKKKDRKKKTAPGALNRERESAVLSLLDDVYRLPAEEAVSGIPDPLTAEALVDRLPVSDERAVSILQAIHDAFKDKRVRKAVKRSLFRLKSKGVPTDGFSDNSDSRSILKPIKRDPPRCYLGPFDAMGMRAVIIHFFESGNGIDVGMGMASDQQGIQQFVFDRMSRKTARDLKAELEEMAGPFIEVPLSHGAMVLEDAFHTENVHNTESRAEYLKLRPWLLQNTSRDYSVNFEGLAPTDQEITEAELERLFDHDLMAGWFAPFEIVKPFMMEMQEVHQSPIILTDVQKQNRVEEIRKRCINALFESDGRKRFKKRLLEMAFFFLKTEDREYARLSLSAAADIKEETSPFSDELVLAYYVDRSIEFYFELGNEPDADEGDFDDFDADETPSGIILPR